MAQFYFSLKNTDTKHADPRDLITGLETGRAPESWTRAANRGPKCERDCQTKLVFLRLVLEANLRFLVETVGFGFKEAVRASKKAGGDEFIEDLVWFYEATGFIRGPHLKEDGCYICQQLRSRDGFCDCNTDSVATLMDLCPSATTDDCKKALRLASNDMNIAATILFDGRNEVGYYIEEE